MRIFFIILILFYVTDAYRPSMRQRVLELHAKEDSAVNNQIKDVKNITDLEKYGYELEESDLLNQIFNSLQALFVTENEPIMSNQNEEATCYTLDNARCNFKAEELPYVFLIEYDQEPGEYSISVKAENNTAVMRRRLKSKDCESFNDVMNLFKRELTCELREYAHVISIKHIG